MLEYTIVHERENVCMCLCACVHMLVRICAFVCVCVHVCCVYFQKPYFSYSSVFSRATPAWHVDPYFCSNAMCPSLSLRDKKSRKKRFRLYLLTPDSAWGVVLFYVAYTHLRWAKSSHIKRGSFDADCGSLSVWCGSFFIDCRLF